MKRLFLAFLLTLIPAVAFAGGFNGSGQYNRYYNWANDKSNGINITASRFDTEDNGFATGLSNTITKDGQQTTTAKIPFILGVSVDAGSAGAPGFSIIGDLQTGFYQSAMGALDAASEGTRVGGFNANGLDNTVIGAGTPKAGSFTTLSATGHTTFEGVTSTGATGTGNLVYSISPTFTGTANMYALTATSITSSFYVGPVLGSTTGVAPASGYVGEQIVNRISTVTNFPTSGNWGDCASVALTAGNWDISEVVSVSQNGATVAGVLMGISSTSGNNPPSTAGDNYIAINNPSAAAGNQSGSIPQYRVLLSGTTTYYAKVYATYSVAVPQYTCRISAVRVP